MITTQSALPLVLLFLTSAVLGQGTAEDYARANNLRQLTENKVFKLQLTAHWQTNKPQFWYRNDLAGGGREFILVNAEVGKRQLAFDHRRLAASLSKAMGQEFDSSRLPIEQLEVEDSGTSLFVQSGVRRWRCDLQTYALDEVPSQASPAAALSRRDTLHPSRRTGPETSITFINRTGAEAKVYWIDANGDRQPYGSVPAGGQKQQHTFAGHVWVMTDPEGKLLAVFEATDQAGTAMIDGLPLPKPQSPLSEEPPAKGSPSGTASPDGKRVAFIKDFNLQLHEVESGQEFALSTDGSSADEYSGQIWWSPDSQKLVALRTTKGGDRKVYYVESSPKDQLQPKLHSYHYLKPGDPIPVAKPQLFHAPSRRHVPVSDALFTNAWSVTDLRWESDSSRFTFLYNQRGHQVLRVLAVDADSGRARALVDEQSPTFIDYAGKQFLRPLETTGELVWMSERDGWNHLYLYDASSGQLKNQITRGAWVVRSVERIDEAARQVWFWAGGVRAGQDPYYLHYCRVNLDGSDLTILTEGDGTHAVQLSPDGRYLIDTWSRVDQAPVHELRRADDGRLVCELEQADWGPLLQTGWQAPERFVAKGRDNQTDIYGIIVRPTQFDPAKHYPIIEDIYAGPHSAFVPKGFSAYSAMHAMAELGFVVVKMDGMGTSQRSKKFHDVCWKNLGDSGFPDRIAWIRAAAARYPFMDLDHVGIYGGSAGGQSSTRALLAYGDFYKVAVSDCGCHDNRMDKIWWNELWMGWPLGPEYEAQSNVTQAHRLQGKLMLMVGEMDENVDPSSTLQVANALIKADKDFDLLLMTGKGHGSAENEYGRRRRADFFVRHLLGVEPRRQEETK